MSSNLRFRSGSVERRTNRDIPTTNYKINYGTERGRTRDISSIRMSRATSYDPFATTSSRSRNSDYGSASTYNSRYSSGISSRYSSTEQLNSYQSKPSSTIHRSTNSTFTPRNIRAGSVSIGTGASATDSLSRYRPPDSTFSKYTPTVNRYEYKSRTPISYSSRTSSSSSYSSGRDYKSMSREKSEEEDVESTFQKLYNKYVTNSKDEKEEHESLAEQVCRRFESKSEAEESDDSLADDTDVLERYQRKSLRRASSTSSITPKASVDNTPSMTPKSSPLPVRKMPNSSPPDAVPLSRKIEIGATVVSAPSGENSTDGVRKIATSIKINGRAVENITPINTEDPKESVQEPVRITIRRDRSKSPNRNDVKILDDPEITKAAEKEEESRTEREKSTSTESDSSRASHRRRRDPTRTVDNLRTSLMEARQHQEHTNPENIRKIPIPLVLITEPSNPSTPMATTPVATTASICLWNKNGSTSDEDEEEYYDDEEEYSSGDWTEGEDDEEYSSDCEFSVSQTFSLQGHLPLTNLYPLSNSNSTSSAVVSEFGAPVDPHQVQEESRGRVDRLFAIPAPTFTCSVSYDGILPEDEDEEFLSDEVHSCEEVEDDDEFRILPIARPGSSSLGAYMSTGSLTSDEDYDGTTVGCTLKLVDRAAQKDSDASDESEYYEDEEEYWDEEYEYEDEDEEDEEYEDENELEEFYDEEVEEDEEELSVKSAEGSGESEESEIETSSKSNMGFQEMSLPVLNSLTASQIEELIEEAVYSELPQDQILAINGTEVEDYTNIKDVNLVPTYVRQMIENVKEEIASRFSDRKPATDFARKAVIQPAKLEKVTVAKVETKIGGVPKEVEQSSADVPKPDKSSLRKSALNMKEEDAKKKAAADEKAAAEKARKLGTVSTLTNRFNEAKNPEKEASVVYKKSSRLEPKISEKPKRTYEVIKPRINDDFDKQMEEIRNAMKNGAKELQSKIKDLSKGILTVTEEAKNREMEEKRRATTEKAAGAIEKAEEEKSRWKAARDAEAEREYARIEAEKHLRKKKILIDVKPKEDCKTDQPKAEPKRTVRRWKPPPPDPNVPVLSFSSGPMSTSSKRGNIEKPTTPVSRRKTTEPPKDVAEKSTESQIPDKTTTSIPTVASMEIADSSVQTTSRIPASQISNGAVATKIRNNTTNGVEQAATTSKRYSSRRKTQEIVNESTHQPKAKRRKMTARKRKFIRKYDRDIDTILGYSQHATFEQLESIFEKASQNRRIHVANFEKIRRLVPTKVFISELTDFDKIYKSSEIRDITASVNLVY